MPFVVPGVAHVPRGEGLVASVGIPAANPEQAAAIEEAGIVFVSAGAGTGKTTVLVERYVKAVVERGLSFDSVLVITYTERAAGELKERIRARLRELGRRDLSREVDRAWISTIHGFCSRLLRSHPFEAGLDPRFRVLDESQARVLRAEAFTVALTEFCLERHPERLRLLATYGARGLRTMLTGVFERLRSAGRRLELAPDAVSELAGRLQELREVAEETLAREPLEAEPRARVELALELVEPDTPPEQLLDLSELAAPAGASERERLASYEDARAAVERAALDEVAARDRDLLQELLLAFDGAYQRAKARESAVDFEDLQLLARDLLRENEPVRARARFRFRSIMVDEFQDTNRLQCELIDLLAGTGTGDPAPAGAAAELFFVGDEFQSIYRFRHADVEVFRERRSQSGGVLALTRNYRSRPEVLSVVNHLFASEFGDDFEPLQAGRPFPDPLFSPAVEVLVTDKSSYRSGRVHWRRAEALHVARRVRELVDLGECAPGDIVLLFAAGTSAEAHEQALREQGLPTYRATGRGYFGQQQVSDVLAYLRLLRNRYDDEALVAVLASPLVGVSNDALVLLRHAAPRRPLFSGLERELPVGLSPRDRRLLEAFRQRHDRLVRLSGSAGLERLCDRIVVDHDYDLAVLARWDGKRRYANIRKLARLARSYEELRGPDIEGFVGFVTDQEAAGAREVEAVAEEEGAEAVRLLTIHAAKGLEFKVVVVCDAGRSGGQTLPDEILCLPDGRFGFKVADPITGKRTGAFAYEEVRTAETAAEQEEEKRLYYVAMTRAIDRLILAGSLDPTRRGASATPIGWVVERLGAVLDAPSPVEVDCEGAVVLVRVDRAPTGGPPMLARPAEQLPLFEAAEGVAASPAFEFPPLAPIPQPPPHRVRRLSYSALALFERCSYRFYAERIVGLSPTEAARGVGEGLTGTEVGDAVHALLEEAAPAAEAAAFVRARHPAATDEDTSRIVALVEAWYGSTLARRLDALDGVRVELPFAFEQDGVLLHGRFDVFRCSGGQALVVDYKTNRLDGETPGGLVEADYRLQRLVYALAALRARADEVEVAYCFLERPEDVVSTLYTAAGTAALEVELSAAIARIQAGEFRPTPSELACAGCPALDRVCAGPRLPFAVAALASAAGLGAPVA
jgi:ATP-dependent exoDNAse (exonuclease V) beta subunit